MNELEQKFDEAIARAKTVHEMVTGRTPPESSPATPYAPIPPEVDAEEYVTRKAATLLDLVQRVAGRSGAVPGGPALSPEPATPALPIPVSLIQGDGELRAVLELPGVPRSNVSVELTGSWIRVRAERPAVFASTGETVLRSEIGAGHLERVIELRQPVDSGGITASLADGLLTIRIGVPANSGQREHINIR